ncbi:MAG: flavin reductase family protein [Planctomycetia bacterium]|nr:flavin reductase family protein [Planctomycetia bacterium]
MDIAPILGQIPSGLFIVTARQGDQETGMLASWVMQAGIEPPMLTVAVNQARYVAEWLTPESPFVVNVLAGDQRRLLSHFGRGFAPGEPAFTGLEIERSTRDVPVLADVLGHLECVVKGDISSGDHRIVLGEIVGGRRHREGEPLVHVRANGLKY